MKKMLITSAIALLLSTSAIPASAETTGRLYVVKSGDTCWKISQKCHIEVSDLLKRNRHIKNGDWIYPGMVLRIPASVPQSDTNNQVKQPTTNVEKSSTTNQSQNNSAEPSQPTTPNTPQPTEQSEQTFEKEVIRLVNEERAKAGLGALRENVALSNVARTKSNDMKDKGYFSHTSPTYGSPFEMMKSFGISYSYAGENIAMGQRTPAEVMKGWMNSEGHRNNILNSNFTEIGVGYAVDQNGRAYWTQMFIRP